MDVLEKKKLINEYDRPLSGDVIEKNANIPSDFLTANSINGIVTDPENRTIWINGMPFGNAYTTPISKNTSDDSFHAEIFNDYGNTDNTVSTLNITDTGVNKLGKISDTVSRQNTFTTVEFEQLLKNDGSDININNFINTVETTDTTTGHIITASDYSHAEGYSNTITNSKIAHVSGAKNIAKDASYSHIEGIFNKASGEGSHIEGFHNTTQEKALFSHAEGLYTDATSIASHTEGIGTITANVGEHAEGHYNYSVKYTSENNNNVLDTSNMIVHTVGVGDSSHRKNAIRIDKDGSVYLAAVNKVQDSTVTKYDPCNYQGQSIYSDAVSGNEERKIESKSLQEIISNINHSESYTYWMLNEMSKNKLLAPGKTYRITDYKIGVNNLFKTQFDSANHMFDILVTASSTSEFNSTAKAVKHDFYGGEGEAQIKYFSNSDLNSWKLDYIFDNSTASNIADWIDTSEIPPRLHVIFPTKDSSVYNFYSDSELNPRFSSDTHINTAITDSTEFDNWVTNRDKFEYIRRTDDGTFYNHFANHTVWAYTDMYFYNCKEESAIEGNEHPIESQHPYRYRWLPYYIENATYYNEYPTEINSNRDYTYCILTNLIDFSNAYSDVNLDTGKQRVLLCKNELKEEITNANISKLVPSIRNKQFDDNEINTLVNSTTLGYTIIDGQLTDTVNIDNTAYKVNNAFELSNPSIIQLYKEFIEGDGLLSGSNSDGLFGLDESLKNKSFYLLFYNTGLYLGNYGELNENTTDSNIWYMMSSYIPSEGKSGYGINNGPLGIFLRLDKDVDVRELTVNKLKAMCGTSELNKTKTNGFYQIPKDKFKILNNEIEVFNESKGFLDENGVSFGTLSGALKEILLNSGLQEDDLPDGDVNVIVADGVVYYRHPTYTYEYENMQYVVWVQIKPKGQVEDSFLISNPNTNNEDVDINNVANIYIINCPKLLAGFESNLNEDVFDILEYSSVWVNGQATYVNPADKSKSYIYNFGKHFNVNPVAESETEFTFDIAEKSTEFQYSVINPDPIIYNRSNEYQFGIINRDDTHYVYYKADGIINNAVNILYETDKLFTSSISEDRINLVNIKILAESSLIPIGYINILSAQAVTAVDNDGKLDTLYYIGSHQFEEGKFNNTGLITRMVDEFGNDCTYDFKNIYFKYNTFGLNSNEPTADYSAYTFTKPYVNTTYVESGHSTNINDVIDASLNENIYNNSLLVKNNKIHNDDLSIIKPIIFRLNEQTSLLQNNTFINCNRIGSAIRTIVTTGSKLQMYDCVFNSCTDLDVVDYFNVYNNKFFNCTGNIDIYSEDGNMPIRSIINSTFYNVNFGNYAGNINTCTISDVSLEDYSTANYNFSNIYKSDFLGNTDQSNNIISFGDTLCVDLNKHSIIGDNSGFSMTTTGKFNLASGNIVIGGSTDNGPIPQIPSSIYTSTGTIYPYIQGGSFGGYDLSSDRRDNGKAKNSNKNTININFEPSGNYTKVAEGTKILLGEIYVVGQWKMFTRAVQTVGVQARTTLKIENIKITRDNGDNNPVTVYNDAPGVTSTYYANGYWSEGKWDSKHQTVCINLRRVLADIKSKNDNIDIISTDGDILLASNTGVVTQGNVNYYNIRNIKIAITCSGFCEADSEGAYDNVGTVTLSDIYYNSSKTTTAMTRGYNGSTTGYNDVQTYPLVYIKAGKGVVSDMQMQFGKDSIRFVAGSNTLSISCNASGEWKILSNSDNKPLLGNTSGNSSW